jgi:hypothetical protein
MPFYLRACHQYKDYKDLKATLIPPREFRTVDGLFSCSLHWFKILPYGINISIIDEIIIVVI